MNREVTFISDLPIGYEYKIFAMNDDKLKIIGISHDKKPIGFILTEDNKLEEIEF